VKSITIHNLDDSLEAMIEEKAREQGLSLNKTVKMLLSRALGLEPGGNGGRKADFAEFSGVWSEADRKEFDKKTQDLRKVDSRDWQ
jgi:plasmid stability protein